MRYYAEVKNGIVLNVAQSEDELNWDGWIEYSPTGEFRGSTAIIGGAYSIDKDKFAAPKPYPSWTFNNEAFEWQAPVAKPQEIAAWDEISQTWNIPE
jgi:hypothetical protein